VLTDPPVWERKTVGKGKGKGGKNQYRKATAIFGGKNVHQKKGVPKLMVVTRNGRERTEVQRKKKRREEQGLRKTERSTD